MYSSANIHIEALQEEDVYSLQKAQEKKEGKQFTFTIKERNFGIIIGLIILKKIDYSKNQAEFAYCLGELSSGKGWTSEAVKAVIDYAIEHFKLHRFQIITHKSNIGSCKIAENNDFVWQRTLKNELKNPRNWIKE